MTRRTMPLLSFLHGFYLPPSLLNIELSSVWRLCLPLLPAGLVLIFPIISMSNDTKGMKPVLPGPYTLPFSQNKKEPNALQHSASGMVTNFSALPACSVVEFWLSLDIWLFFSQSPWANFIYSAHWLLLLHNTENICFTTKPTEYLFWFLLLVVNRVQNTLYYHCSKLVENYVNSQHSDCVAQISWLPHLLLQ